MPSDYHGDTYHLISKNCNHFSNDISQRITGKRIRGWVNRLTKLGSKLIKDEPEEFQLSELEALALEIQGFGRANRNSEETANEICLLLKQRPQTPWMTLKHQRSQRNPLLLIKTLHCIL
ncbi:hypothetical protein L1887_37731 [Cichorium endivia]|nr:hypothetical protein L1887_37731 [Cichorium endivia]